MTSSNQNMKSYRALKTEQGVFTTPPYSTKIKPLWRFVNANVAATSAAAIWAKFEMYRNANDFIGMDICRKFLQMGRTRSLRYALRRGGKKYGTSSSTGAATGESETTGGRVGKQPTRKEIPRTGKIYDEEKSKGASIFENYVKRCWEDETYVSAFEEWKAKHNTQQPKAKSMGSKEGG
ncbi:hypothetical protein M231_03163 [Tremella mesenterica]|uniref:Uncharacterized protein n=1 Tax=Tremella mesenterica TaxID=5217 RepID=A0A4Q1BNQ0_TREME|nr:hypothetical protein M231_03163 [Tremella mesenterica]